MVKIVAIRDFKRNHVILVRKICRRLKEVKRSLERGVFLWEQEIKFILKKIVMEKS